MRAASAAFFAGLGFVVAGAHDNAGPEQARLDGFAGLASATVSITSLSPPGGERPGVELLGYREPEVQIRPARDGASAATVIVLAGWPARRRRAIPTATGSPSVRAELVVVPAKRGRCCLC